MKFAHCQQYKYVGRRGGGGGGGGADDKFVILLVKRDTAWYLRSASRITLGLRPRVIRLASRRYQAVSLFYKEDN